MSFVIFVIGIVLGFVLSAVGLFAGHLKVFDSIAIGIVSGVSVWHFSHIHPILSLIVGIAVFLLMIWIHSKKAGFWIISSVISLVYALILGVLAYGVSNHSILWTIITSVISFLAVGWLHIRARKLDSEG